MAGQKKDPINPNFCPQCKKFIVFTKRAMEEAPHLRTMLYMGTEDTPVEGQILCQCGFVVSDMTDIHPKRPWLVGNTHHEKRKKPVQNNTLPGL